MTDSDSTVTPTAAPARTVPERWWHRLLRVLVHLSTAIVLLMALYVNVDDAKEAIITYAFDPGYAQDAGKEYDCYIYDSLEEVSCDRRFEPSEFINAYLSRRGDELASKHWVSKEPKPEFDIVGKSAREFIVHIRTKMTDLAIVSALLKDQLKWKRRHVYPLNATAKAVALTALWTSLWWFGWMGVYKLILYIAHGHTRVVRVNV